MRFTRFDRWENQLGSVRPISATHEEALDGTDTLSLTTFAFLEKGDRLVWKGPDGVWHENVVDSCKETHDANGKAVTQATCINSICETLGDHIDSLKLTNVGVGTALASVLGVTRWTSAGSDVPGTFDFAFEDTSAREAINTILKTANAGELRAYVSVTSTGVSTRHVGIQESRGSSTVTRRFTYSKSVTSVRRTVEGTDPVTALYLYGKASEDSSGNPVRLTVESVNGGKKYVEDTTALQHWGRWNADHTQRVHHFGSYTDEQCDDPNFLLAEGTKQLQNLSQPEITYEVDVIDAEHALAGVALGDAVDVIDASFNPPLRMRDRVSRIRRDLMLSTATGTVTIGNRRSVIVRQYEATKETAKKQRTSSAKVEAGSPSWDAAGGLDSAWVSSLGDSLNGNSSYINDLISALESAGMSGSTGLFPVDNDATTPTVRLDDLDGSNLQGVTLQAAIGGVMQNLARAYRSDSYGGFLLEVGLACYRLLAISGSSGGADAYIYPPCPPTSTYGDKGYIKLGRSDVQLCGPLHDALFGSARPLADLVLGSGSFELNVLSSSVQQVQHGGASISGGDGWVDIRLGNSVTLTLDNTGANGFISLSVGNNTLALDANGVSYNGTVIHS